MGPLCRIDGAAALSGSTMLGVWCKHRLCSSIPHVRIEALVTYRPQWQGLCPPFVGSVHRGSPNKPGKLLRRGRATILTSRHALPQCGAFGLV